MVGCGLILTYSCFHRHIFVSRDSAVGFDGGPGTREMKGGFVEVDGTAAEAVLRDMDGQGYNTAVSH